MFGHLVLFRARPEIAAVMGVLSVCLPFPFQKGRQSPRPAPGCTSGLVNDQRQEKQRPGSPPPLWLLVQVPGHISFQPPCDLMRQRLVPIVTLNRGVTVRTSRHGGAHYTLAEEERKGE